MFVLGVVFSDIPWFHASKSQIIPIPPSALNLEKPQLKSVHADPLPPFFFYWKRNLRSLISSPFYFSISLTKLVSWIDLTPFYSPWVEYTLLSSLNIQIVSTFQKSAEFHCLLKVLNFTPIQPYQLSFVSSPAGTFYFLNQSLFLVKTPMVLWHWVIFSWIA